MKSRYDLVVYDIDGTIAPSGRVLTVEQLRLVDTTNPEQFKTTDKSGFSYNSFSGVVKTVRQLRPQVRQAVISNGLSLRQRNKLTLMGLEDCFDPVYIAEEFARSFFEEIYKQSNRPELQKTIEKPSPMMFIKMNLETQTLPSKCVYVGNTIVDYEAAKRAGWDFIGIIDADLTYRDDFKKEQKLKLVQQHEFNRILEHILG